jgi:hypothetical protein
MDCLVGVRYRGEPPAAIVVLRGRNDHYRRPTPANFLLHWLAIQMPAAGPPNGTRWANRDGTDVPLPDSKRISV